MAVTRTIAYNRKSHDYDMWLNEEYVGSRATYHEAEDELDRLVYEMLTHERRAA